MIKINEGAVIPLICQAHDGNKELEIVCVLTEFNSKKEFMRVNMQHIANGLYVNNDVEMPNLGIITAQYFINSDEYNVSIDIYEPILKPELIEKIIVGEAVSKTKSNLIIGVVVKSEKKISNT
jgi:hypothetical protein